jgi:hypothetical protein
LHRKSFWLLRLCTNPANGINPNFGYEFWNVVKGNGKTRGHSRAIRLQYSASKLRIVVTNLILTGVGAVGYFDVQLATAYRSELCWRDTVLDSRQSKEIQIFGGLDEKVGTDSGVSSFDLGYMQSPEWGACQQSTKHGAGFDGRCDPRHASEARPSRGPATDVLSSRYVLGMGAA